MNEEIASLQNQTWELIDCRIRKKSIGCRWIFTVKHKVNDTIEHFKTKLVAKGYNQTYKIDYAKMFALTVKINIVRVLLSLAANFD